MSAFAPTNSDSSHQTGQVSSGSINEMYGLPYFPAAMINPYGYQFNPAAATGIPNGFPNMTHTANPMHNMTNLQSHHQISHLPTDSSNATLRFLQNNNISFYNNNTKNEMLEQSPISQNINESKSSSISSVHDSMRSGDSSVSPPNENQTPARAIKPSAKTSKQPFKSPEEEGAYRVRRQKNNEAARQSRIRRQQREKELQLENDKLKSELAYWKSKYNQEIAMKAGGNQVLAEIQNR